MSELTPAPAVAETYRACRAHPESDHRFFERRPNRRHRVRLAGQAEIAQQELIHGSAFWLPPECRIFAAVRRLATGGCERLMFRGIEGAETDLSEARATAIFETAATMGADDAEGSA